MVEARLGLFHPKHDEFYVGLDQDLRHSILPSPSNSRNVVIPSETPVTARSQLWRRPATSVACIMTSPGIPERRPLDQPTSSRNAHGFGSVVSSKATGDKDVGSPGHVRHSARFPMEGSPSKTRACLPCLPSLSKSGELCGLRYKYGHLPPLSPSNPLSSPLFRSQATTKLLHSSPCQGRILNSANRRRNITDHTRSLVQEQKQWSDKTNRISSLPVRTR